MKNKWNTPKRLLALALCLCMVLGMMPAIAMAAEETVTLYFSNTASWSEVNAYYWGGTSELIWPGVPMTNLGGGIWSIEVPADAVNIIFNNGSGSQTPDLTIPTDGNNCYDTVTWTVYTAEGGDTGESQTGYDVDVGGTVTNYTDFLTAMNAACAAESATLILHQDVDSGLYDFNSGNVILDLNGKTVNGRIGVIGCNLTVTDTAETKGTVVDYSGAAFDYVSGKLIILDTTDCIGNGEGHGPWSIGRRSDTAADAGTIGTTSTEDIVLPTDYAALFNGVPVTLLPDLFQSVYIHRHDWTDAACTAPKTCDLCGATEGDALGHRLDIDGICTVCGLATNKTIINMTDYYGDGWNGNAIDVYEDDVLVATVTIDEGNSGTWMGEYDPEKIYRFYWVQGEYSNECAFEIICGGEAVFTAAQDDCASFADGQLIFPTCQHVYDEGVEKAPACTADGYTTYTCTLCGHSYTDNEVPATGHSYDDGVCTICGLGTATMTIYFQNNWLWTDVSLYYWGSSAENPNWPGTAMTLYGNDGTYDVYVMEVPTDISGIIINGTKNDDSGTRDQTPDITDGWYDGICYYMTWDNGNQVGSEPIDNIVSSTYTVTFAGDGTQYLESVTVDANTVITLPCRFYDLAVTGKVFMGYNTEEDGTGETYMDCTAYTVTGNVTLYTQWADIAVGDGFLNSGEYMDLEGSVTTAKPQGGYAYYENGTLILHDFTYSGAGYTFFHNPALDITNTSSVYYAMDDLNVVLEGENSLTNPTESGYGLRGDMNVTISGTGSLTVSAGYIAVFSGIDLTVESGTLYLTATDVTAEAIYACGDFTLNDGSVTVVSSQTGVRAMGDHNQGNIVVNGGTLDVTGKSNVVTASGALIVNGGFVAVSASDEHPLRVYDGGIILENVLLLAPANGAVDNSAGYYRLVDSEGNEAKSIVIGEAHTHIEKTVSGYAATCTEDGLTDGTKCSICGMVLAAQEIIPGGHSFGEDGICTVCGHDKSSELTINMTDYYGDGWNGNAIEVYEDGVLVATVTIEEGDTETWTGSYDPAREYTFFWVLGDWSEECFFEILVAGEAVFTAAVGECDEFTDGELIFTIYGAAVEQKNGILAEDGSLYYYENDIRTYAGLIVIDGAYYYVRTSGEVVHGRSYWITKHNDLLPVGSYNFDETGKMVLKNGFVEEDGGIYYYVDNARSYAGLIELDGAYYYVRTSGQVVTGCTYWVTKTNDLMPAGGYYFDETGKMTPRNGIIEEYGSLYYYVDDERVYAGLILVDGSYYYVRTSGEVVRGRSYWITKTNGLLPAAYYEFDENGVMIDPPV